MEMPRLGSLLFLKGYNVEVLKILYWTNDIWGRISTQSAAGATD